MKNEVSDYLLSFLKKNLFVETLESLAGFEGTEKEFEFHLRSTVKGFCGAETRAFQSVGINCGGKRGTLNPSCSERMQLGSESIALLKEKLQNL